MQQKQYALLEQLSSRSLPSPQATLSIEEPESALFKPKSKKSGLTNHPQLYQKRLCSLNRCCCACHETTFLQGRSWSLKCPSSWIWRQCNKASCQHAKNVSFWFSLTQLGVPWAVCVSFDFMLSSHQSHISPSLGFQRVVRRTSPGFKLLWELQTGQRKDWIRARQDLTELFESGKASPQDVDPDGQTWLEVCWVINCFDIYIILLNDY
jgi:hypothetical protein